MRYFKLLSWLMVLALTLVPYQPASCLSTAGLNDAAAIIPNFGEVDKHVYRGGFPGAEGLQALKDSGIRTVVSFLHDPELIAEESEICRDLGLKFVSIPLTGLDVPTEGDVQAFLLQTKRAQDEPLFVHCRRGADRTGAMVGIYRIENFGWNANRAYKEMRRYGFIPLFANLSKAVFAYSRLKGRPCKEPVPGFFNTLSSGLGKIWMKG